LGGAKGVFKGVPAMLAAGLPEQQLPFFSGGTKGVFKGVPAMLVAGLPEQQLPFFSGGAADPDSDPARGLESGGPYGVGIEFQCGNLSGSVARTPGWQARVVVVVVAVLLLLVLLMLISLPMTVSTPMEPYPESPSSSRGHMGGNAACKGCVASASEEEEEDPPGWPSIMETLFHRGESGADLTGGRRALALATRYDAAVPGRDGKGEEYKEVSWDCSSQSRSDACVDANGVADSSRALALALMLASGDSVLREQLHDLPFGNAAVM
jgi:hypothetical protein